MTRKPARTSSGAAVALWVLLALSCPLLAETAGLEPENTHAVIIGVLDWETASLTSYPAEGRKDRDLYEALATMGVPRRNMVLLLDERATLSRIRKSLRRVARRAKTGDSVIVYYAGHGWSDGTNVYFANHDAESDDTRATWFAVSEISDIFDKGFRGDRILLFADCCNSGGLARPAAELARRGVGTASLTSSTAADTSTGSWTFTHTLVDVFRGSPAADRDGDGAITLVEAVEEVADAMRYLERQRHGYSRFGIAENFRLRSANEDRPGLTTPMPHELFGYVRVRHDGFWKPARIVDYRDGTFMAELPQDEARQVVRVDVHEVRELGDVQPLPADGADHPSPTHTLSPENATARAAVDGKYSELARKIEVEQDYRTYSVFHDYGYDDTEEYAGHGDLPEGYWVYVYPHWYIWRESHR